MGIETVNSVVWIGIINKVSSERRVRGGGGGAIQYLQDDGPSRASRKDGSCSDR